MLREVALSALHWCEKTMSVMKEQQLEACEKRIANCPKSNLFDPDCRLDDIQKLWDCSFYAQEAGIKAQLFRIKELQEMVFHQMEKEIDLVSVNEHMLLERMLVFEGEAELIEWDEISAAEALVARLWCSLSQEGDHFYIRLPKTLQMPMLEMMNSEKHVKTRESLFGFDATIHGLLYVAGFLHADQPIAHFIEEVAGGSDPLSYKLARRYLSAAFDYTFDDRGEMILIHPGLADPRHLICQLYDENIFSLEIDQNMMLGGMNGIFSEEAPLFDAMCAALLGALRPEYQPEDAALDLRLLAKQGVSFEEMREVLSSMITGLPTRGMLDVLKRVSAETPMWAGLRAKRQN